MGPFGAWCLHRTLRDMLGFIHLGFELELFAPCEHTFCYWYTDLLCGMQMHLQREVGRMGPARLTCPVPPPTFESVRDPTETRRVVSAPGRREVK